MGHCLVWDCREEQRFYKKNKFIFLGMYVHSDKSFMVHDVVKDITK